MIDLNSTIAQTVQPYLFQNGFILTDLPTKELETLQQNLKTEARKRGEVLFRQGSYPTGAFLLVSGKVKIFQEMADGQRQTLYIYSDGDMIGYRQLIAEETHPVTAVLLEDTIIGFIPGKTFRGLLDSSSFFSRNVLMALAREFSIWMKRITAFSQLPVRQRLVLALLMLYEQYRRSGSPPGVITMNRTELAEFVGASLETVIRALNALKINDLVVIRGRRILLPNPLGLMEILQREGGEAISRASSPHNLRS